MQGHHEYQQELFSQIDYQQLIPPKHLLRKIDKVLDLGFLTETTKPFYVEEKGRPSIAPEIFVRMVFVQALYGIDSDRQLCEEVSYNLAYRWFCKLSLTDRVPDHSSITRIRDRFGEETFATIFKKVVEQCQKAGLVKAEQIMVDGSTMRAIASIYNMVERVVWPPRTNPIPMRGFGKRKGPIWQERTIQWKTSLNIFAQWKLKQAAELR